MIYEYCMVLHTYNCLKIKKYKMFIINIFLEWKDNWVENVL